MRCKAWQLYFAAKMQNARESQAFNRVGANSFAQTMSYFFIEQVLMPKIE